MDSLTRREFIQVHLRLAATYLKEAADRLKPEVLLPISEHMKYAHASLDPAEQYIRDEIKERT